MQLIGRLRALRLTMAFILRRSLTRTMMTALANIPRRVGFANLKSGWLLTHRVRAPQAPLHKAQTYLRLLAPFGTVESPGRYEFYLSQAERTQAAAWLREQGMPDGKPMVILHPGANWTHKRWSPERFAELANRLSQERPLSLIVTGGPDDLPLVQAIRSRLTQRPIVLAGAASFRQLAARLERADLVVSNDTGVLHVASALNRPIVGLYGPTSPTLTGPLGDPERTALIHHPGCCPEVPCYDPHHPGYPGMDAILVDEVYAAAVTLLEQRPKMREAAAPDVRGAEFEMRS
jgi:lipopolysaccharide heptosyltransferase II